MQDGLFTQAQLTSSLVAHHASRSASRGSDKDCPTHAADSCLLILRSLSVCDLDGLFGKMSPVSCQAEEDGTFVPSSGRWGTWGMGGHTASWTLSGSEHNGIHAPSRSDGGVCSLSDVLETGQVPPRFYLSPKACAGILRRAEVRGKKLPPMLQDALEAAVTVASPAVEENT